MTHMKANSLEQPDPLRIVRSVATETRMMDTTNAIRIIGIYLQSGVEPIGWKNALKTALTALVEKDLVQSQQKQAIIEDVSLPNSDQEKARRELEQSHD